MTVQRFDLGALADWSPIGVGELMAFDLPSNGYRAIDFDILSDRFISVLAATPQESWLVGAGEGHLSIQFSTAEAVGISIAGDASAICMIRTRLRAQVVQESAEATFTTIEPRGDSVSDDFKRMMLVMQHNQRLRDAQIDAELASVRKRAEAAEALVEALPKPEAAGEG